MSLSILTLVLLMFIDWMGIGLVYPMFSSMIFHDEMLFFPPETSLTLKKIWFGILLSIGPMAQFFSAPIFGALCDFKGRKPILILSLSIIVIGYIISFCAVWLQSFFGLLIGRMIVGIGSASGAVVCAAVADVSTSENKAKNFGLVSMACGVGFMLGPFIGGKLSDWGGHDKPFLFAFFVTLINFFLMLIAYKESYQPSENKQHAFNLIAGLKHVKRAFFFPGLAVIFISFFLMAVGWSFYWEFIPITWIHVYGLGISDVAYFYAYGAAIYAISSAFLVQPIVKRLSLNRTLLAAFSGLSLSILILLVHTRLEWFWFYIPFQQYFLALIYPTTSAIISNAASKDSQGEVMGIMHSVYAFAFAISPLMTLLFASLSHQMPMVIGGITITLGGLILIFHYLHSKKLSYL